MFTNLLNRRNPANAKRQAAVSRTLDNVGCSFVSATIALRMSAVMGSFLLTSLASSLLRPSNVVVTREFSVGDGTLARLWAHVIEYTASSTAALDPVVSAKCCR